MAEVEKRGKPAIGIFAKVFERDAQNSYRALGASFAPIAIVPTILANQPPETIVGYAEAMYPKVVEAFTKVPLDVSVTPAREAETLEVLTFQGKDLLYASEEMNRVLVDYNWSDGFPLVPPTHDRVERMLTGTTRSPSEVIAVMAPGFGVATVEKIAINAVMAGCRPEHLPVVIAAVQAMVDPFYPLRSMSTSSGPHTPLLVVNGPVAKELKINSDLCCFGPGGPSYANTVIGRTVRLIMMNIGHARPTEADMDTHGHPQKYSACIAEAVDNSPWIPLHVYRGYSPETSTVTVFTMRHTMDIGLPGDHTPEGIVRHIAVGMSNGAINFSGIWLVDPSHLTSRRSTLADRDNHKMYNSHCLIILGPSQAKVIARHNWTKTGISEFLYLNARVPFRDTHFATRTRETLRPEWRWLYDSPDSMVPVARSPECIEIVVAGGEGPKSMYIAGEGQAVTKIIQK